MEDRVTDRSLPVQQGDLQIAPLPGSRLLAGEPVALGVDQTIYVGVVVSTEDLFAEAPGGAVSPEGR